MDTVPSHGSSAQGRDALGEHIAALAGDPAARQGAIEAVALGLVDSLLAGDAGAVRAALIALRGRRATAGEPDATGAISAFAATAYWGLERLPSPADGELVARGTLAWRLLAALADGPVGSAELRDRLSTDETQVSRAGARLLDAGLVMRRKAGRRVSWELSPRGRAALRADAGGGAVAEQGPPRRAPGEPDAGRPGTDLDWWRELIRTAWRAPASAADHGSGDPVTDRILSTALELHTTVGVLGTSWPRLAAAAEVPVEAVAERFATVEDLVPACGRVAMHEMRLPPPDQAPALFAGQDSGGRLRTLVTTLFDLYERAAPPIETLRREGDELPVLDLARAAVEEALDGLVAAALEPDRRAPDAVRVARTLTDIPVWRALRAGGVESSRAVEVVAAALREEAPAAGVGAANA